MPDTTLERIRLLEQDTTLLRNEICHLVQRLDSLTRVLTTISLMFGGSILAAFGFLTRYWIMGG